MQYSVAQLHTHFAEPFMRDLLVDMLAGLGFDSFETNDDADDAAQQGEADLKAYIPTALLDEKAVRQALDDFQFKGVESVSFLRCEDKDWNAEWERSCMKPIIVGSRCVIHSSFAVDVPECEYDIVIDPKMAFGTGQHQTTALMLEAILDLPVEGAKVLDMGCGTAVLAILAAKRGAAQVTAIDIDDWCVDNAQENIKLNNLTDIEVLLGDARLLSGRHFDIILANINRNILLADMPRYSACLSSGGWLVISGFYDDDVPMLIQKAEQEGLTAVSTKTNDRWTRLILRKE